MNRVHDILETYLKLQRPSHHLLQQSPNYEYIIFQWTFSMNWFSHGSDWFGSMHWLQLHLQVINYLYFQSTKLLSDFRRLITLMMLLQSLWSLNALVTIYYSPTVQIINSKLFQWIGWFIHVSDFSGSTTDCVALEQKISSE